MRRPLEELSVEQCLDLLERHTFGRLAFDDGNGPLILPSNYLYRGGVLHVRTSEGSKLDAADRRAPACFEIDAAPLGDVGGWSVVVRGSLRRMIAAEGGEGAEPEPSATGDRHHLIGLTPTIITGRRLAAVPMPPAVQTLTR